MPQISTIHYKDIQEAMRFDAEYFKPEYLSDENIIERGQFFVLSSIANIRGGKRLPLGETFSSSGIPYIRAEDIKNSFVSFEDSPKISLELHKKLSRYQTRFNDVLITIVGSVGSMGIVKFDIEKCNLTENAARISNLQKINPETLFVYLLSKYGQNQIEREKVGTVQEKLALIRIANFKIPAISVDCQNKIKDAIEQAQEYKDRSKKLYQEAEELLLRELGLIGHEVRHRLAFSTTKRGVDEAGRIDAEYFQPKYQEIIDKIESYPGGWDIVSNQFNQNLTLSKKDSEFCNYIEISDIDVSNGEISPNKIEVVNIPANGKRKLYRNNLLVSKVRPYRGAVSFIDFDAENLLGSGAFTVLQEKTEYKKEVLMVFLRTMFIKELLLKYNCGTSYPVIKDEDILNLKLPLIKKEIQEQIAEKITKNHRLRKESKELLERAKLMVEREIEREEK